MKKVNWYFTKRFPLLPKLEFKKGDEYNTSGFTFKWLFIKCWSLDGFSFEFGVVFDSHFGLGLAIVLPYIRLILAIPPFSEYSCWQQKYLWRKPKSVILNK